MPYATIRYDDPETFETHRVRLEGRVEIRERGGLVELLVRHPSATDFEHDSLILSAHTLGSLSFSSARLNHLGGAVFFDALLLGIADWGDEDPLAGAVVCSSPQCIADGGHLMTDGERYYPPVKRWLEPAKAVVDLIFDTPEPSPVAGEREEGGG